MRLSIISTIRVALWTALTALLVVSTGLALGTELTVSPDGVLLKDGKPYRGIGMNIADAYHRLWMHPGDFSYDRDFATLEVEGIPFARIPATAFAPSDVRNYVINKDDYLMKLDGVVKSAEKHHVGLIMDLFWWDAAVPDIVHEPRSAWGDPKSRTIAFMRDYTQTIVSRYKDSPAVWAWEFGNELSLDADLPNAADWRPQINPVIGWPAKRTKADDLTTKMILVAFTEFAKAVREVDPTGAITTGKAFPRQSAEVQRRTLTWARPDTRAEFRANLALVNPDPVDVLSVHLYADDLRYNRFGKAHETYDDLLKEALKVSAASKKPLFIGEMASALGCFGLKTTDDVKKDFDAKLKAVVDNRIPLAAYWEISTSDTLWNDPLNITREKGLGWRLDAIKAANAQIDDQLQAEARLADLLPKFETAIQAARLDVRTLQKVLADRGFKPGENGKYGAPTKSALTACIAAGSCTAIDLPAGQ